MAWRDWVVPCAIHATSEFGIKQREQWLQHVRDVPYRLARLLTYAVAVRCVETARWVLTVRLHWSVRGRYPKPVLAAQTRE